ncbi:MAG: amino-acid N-acetyltransferase [Gammaproteobacteria bacterium]
MNSKLIRPAIQEAGSYLRSMANQHMVVHLPIEQQSSSALQEHLADLSLLASLHVHLTLVFSPPQLLPEKAMSESQLQSWILDVQKTQLELVGRLSRALPDFKPSIVHSNAVTARPAGVSEGQHAGHLGTIRSIHSQDILNLARPGRLILMPPLAASLLGNYYALDPLRLAVCLAKELKARKLLLLTQGIDRITGGKPLGPLSVTEVEQLIHSNSLAPQTIKALDASIQAGDVGIERVHLLDINKKGVLIDELCTRQGAGALLAAHNPERIRPAKPEDASAILRIIEPLEQDGTLIQRGRTQLEQELEQFWVMEMDSQIIGCCALLDLGTEMELAALAVDPAYRGQSYAHQLVQRAEQKARAQGAKRIFVFTTVAEDWFLERGFTKGSIKDLPAQRAALYNYSRHSVVLIKHLSEPAAAS